MQGEKRFQIVAQSKYLPPAEAMVTLNKIINKYPLFFPIINDRQQLCRRKEKLSEEPREDLPEEYIEGDMIKTFNLINANHQISSSNSLPTDPEHRQMIESTRQSILANEFLYYDWQIDPD